MCAVIGAYLQNPTPENLVTLENVFRESSIRGLHATGISWVRNNNIHTYITKTPASEFLHNFSLSSAINEDGSLYLIGHCRYSTSDLNYNQPLYNKDVSIVHNGVVSQEMPENWQRLYGYKCETLNDSELILHTLKAKKSPLVEFPDSSMAVVELYREKKLRFYRNGKRPIYFTSLPNGGIITSTKDIAIRSGLSDSIEVDMNTYLTIGDGLVRKEFIQIQGAKDLQP